MSLEAILTGIAAILTAAGAVVIIVREFRRRERRVMQGQIHDLERELEKLQHDYLELRKFMMQISELLVANGIEPPEIPVHES